MFSRSPRSCDVEWWWSGGWKVYEAQGPCPQGPAGV